MHGLIQLRTNEKETDSLVQEQDGTTRLLVGRRSAKQVVRR